MIFFDTKRWIIPSEITRNCRKNLYLKMLEKEIPGSFPFSPPKANGFFFLLSCWQTNKHEQTGTGLNKTSLMEVTILTSRPSCYQTCPSNTNNPDDTRDSFSFSWPPLQLVSTMWSVCVLLFIRGWVFFFFLLLSFSGAEKTPPCDSTWDRDRVRERGR